MRCTAGTRKPGKPKSATRPLKSTLSTDHWGTTQAAQLRTVLPWNTNVRKGPLFKKTTMAQVHWGKRPRKAPDKRTSRCWNIRLTVAPHWVGILLEQRVKTNTRTQRHDTWHFKAIRLDGRLFFKASVAWRFHSHPSWNPSPTAFPVTASSSSSSSPLPVLPLENTWVPLVFYCLSTPLKLN